MVTNAGKSPLIFSAQGDSITGVWHITYMRWTGASTAGHLLVVNDGDGDLIWDSEADGADFLDIHPLFEDRKGINVATMDSGHLLVYYR